MHGGPLRCRAAMSEVFSRVSDGEFDGVEIHVSSRRKHLDCSQDWELPADLDCLKCPANAFLFKSWGPKVQDVTRNHCICVREAFARVSDRGWTPEHRDPCKSLLSDPVHLAGCENCQQSWGWSPWDCHRGNLPRVRSVNSHREREEERRERGERMEERGKRREQREEIEEKAEGVGREERGGERGQIGQRGEGRER